MFQFFQKFSKMFWLLLFIITPKRFKSSCRYFEVFRISDFVNQHTRTSEKKIWREKWTYSCCTSLILSPWKGFVAVYFRVARKFWGFDISLKWYFFSLHIKRYWIMAEHGLVPGLRNIRALRKSKRVSHD